MACTKARRNLISPTMPKLSSSTYNHSAMKRADRLLRKRGPALVSPILPLGFDVFGRRPTDTEPVFKPRPRTNPKTRSKDEIPNRNFKTRTRNETHL
jgi:hypothetical protein